jgi:hypothetical protein
VLPLWGRVVTIGESIAGLYIAYFNRAPDKNGLNYWKAKGEKAKNSGKSIYDVLKELSSGFASQPLFISKYSNLSNRDFVKAIYKNILGREGDSEGIEYWTNDLDEVKSRSDMISDFIQANLSIDITRENYPNLDDDELDIAKEKQNLFINKVEVALSFADILGNWTNIKNISNLENDPAYQASIKILEGVTADRATVNDKVQYLNNVKDKSNPIAEINGEDSKNLYSCNGSAIIKYSYGEYQGECKRGKRDGYGVMRWIYGENNETVYKGYWEDDKRNGYGEIEYWWGSVYKGDWIDNSREGSGTYYYSTGTIYKGQWKNDEPNGYGVIKYYWGTTYKGYWKDWERNGYGVIEYYDGVKYEGNWIDDVIDLDISKYIIELQESDNILTVVMPQKDYDMLDNKELSMKSEFLKPFIKKVVYQKFKDNFDNIIIIYNNKTSQKYKYIGKHHSILQDIKGIGEDIYDSSLEYGSQHILRSIITFPSIDDFRYVFFHEILHRFSNSFIPTTYAGHYSFTTGGVLGGFSSETLKQIDNKIYTAHYKNSKTFGIGANPPAYNYSFLDLYLMGLASKDEVPEIKIARCDDNKTNCLYWIDENNGKFHADYIETLTIDDLIKKHGERIPKYGNAPNSFRGLVILISPNKIERENIDELNKNIKQVTDNFYDYTLERATVKFDDLSDKLKN